MVFYCTGYQISFPFLDEPEFSVNDNEVWLYHRVVPPRLPGLYFIGLVQPIGAIMPMAEAQSEWVADLLEGKATLPDEAEMNKEIARNRRVMGRRFVTSARHTIQVDFYDHLREMQNERKAGTRRNGTSRAIVDDRARGDLLAVAQRPVRALSLAPWAPAGGHGSAPALMGFSRSPVRGRDPLVRVSRCLVAAGR